MINKTKTPKLASSFQSAHLVGMLANQVQQQKQLLELQKQVIEEQKKIIALQQQIQEMTPKTPNEKDLHWHIFSGRVENDIVATGDLSALVAYHDWIINFGKKYIQPYVHPHVYGEILTQMTRGLSRRIAELEVMTKFGTPPSLTEKTVARTNEKSKPPKPAAKSVEASVITSDVKENKSEEQDNPQQLLLIQ